MRTPIAFLILLASTASTAATVTITPSTLTPLVGQEFTIVLTAEVPNARAATMGLSFDSATVAYVSGAGLTPPWGRFTKNTPATHNPTVFDVSGPTIGTSPAPYDFAVLTFKALAYGNANIVINDDGGNVSGWFTPGATYIPVTYQQASIQVVPAPQAVWLLGTGLAGLAGRRLVRRQRDYRSSL